MYEVKLIGLTQIDWPGYVDFAFTKMRIEPTKTIDESRNEYSPAGAWNKSVESLFGADGFCMFQLTFAIIIPGFDVTTLTLVLGGQSVALDMSTNVLVVRSGSVAEWRLVVERMELGSTYTKNLGSKIKTLMEKVAHEVFYD